MNLLQCTHAEVFTPDHALRGSIQQGLATGRQVGRGFALGGACGHHAVTPKSTRGGVADWYSRLVLSLTVLTFIARKAKAEPCGRRTPPRCQHGRQNAASVAAPGHGEQRVLQPADVRPVSNRPARGLPHRERLRRSELPPYHDGLGTSANLCLLLPYHHGRGASFVLALAPPVASARISGR